MYQLIKQFQTTPPCLRNLINRSSRHCGTVAALLLMLAFACFTFSPSARAMTPTGDASHPNRNTIESEDAVLSLTTGGDNALASWIWRATGSLNTAREQHTATLLPSGKVLVAGGYNFNLGGPLSSAELYDPASGTWTATGSLNARRYYHTAM